MLLYRQYHQLLQDLIAHEELLGRSRNVSVVVQDAETCETGNLDLHGDVTGQVRVDLSLLGWVDTRVQGRCRVIETLVPDLEYHIL